jgi:hypothetical protein
LSCADVTRLLGFALLGTLLFNAGRLSRLAVVLVALAFFFRLTLTLLRALTKGFLTFQDLVFGHLLFGACIPRGHFLLIGLEQGVQFADVLVLKGRAGARFHVDLVLFRHKKDVLALQVVTFREFVNPHSVPFRNLTRHRGRSPASAENFSLDDDGGQSPISEGNFTLRNQGPAQPRHLPRTSWSGAFDGGDCREFQRS